MTMPVPNGAANTSRSVLLGHFNTVRAAMSRGKKKKASHPCAPPPASHKFCTYCQVHRISRAFAKHQKACKRIWQIDHEARGVKQTLGPSSNNERQRNENLRGMVNTSKFAVSYSRAYPPYLDRLRCRSFIRDWTFLDGHWWSLFSQRYADLRPTRLRHTDKFSV